MGASILVWGAGAIGGTVGAYLARAGHHVTFVDTSVEHVGAINSDGLRIVGPVDEFTVRVPAFTPGALKGSWPIVALAVKAQFTEQACNQLKSHMAAEAYVLSLQNGLCELAIERQLGSGRAVGSLVGFMGDQLGPGIIRFGQRARFCIGELDGARTQRIDRLHTILRDFEPSVEVTDDIWGFLWGKLGFVALLYGTALGTSPMLQLFESRALLNAWRNLAGEVVTVAAAYGIRPRAFDGFDPTAFTSRADPRVSRRSLDAMSLLLRDSPKTHSGIWRDLAIHRRNTEVEHQIGPILDLAAHMSIPVPTLRRVMQLIQCIERGELRQDDALLYELVGRRDQPAIPPETTKAAPQP